MEQRSRILHQVRVMLRRAIDVAIVTDAPQAVLDPVVVHEVQNLLASTRGSETAGMRDTRVQGECEHGDDRDEGGGGAKTHAGAG
jgi:hypothetical protein